MKPGHSLILGSAIAGCTAALAVYLAAKGSPSTGHSSQTTDRNPQSVPVATKRHVSPNGGDTPGPTAKAPRATVEASPEFRILGQPPAGRVAEEREWFANAERIERRANRELADLRETLDLTPDQQHLVFDTLARNSPSWMPGMRTGGSHGLGVVDEASRPANRSNPSRRESPGPTANPSAPVERPGTDPDPAQSPSVTDEVLAVLDYDQQQALIQEELNRRAWWEEILPQLLPPELPAAGLPNAGDTKAYEGPTELLEE
jgi:hypothetical protein